MQEKSVAASQDEVVEERHGTRMDVVERGLTCPNLIRAFLDPLR